MTCWKRNLRNLTTAILVVSGLTGEAAVVLSGAPTVDGGAATLGFTTDLVFPITTSGEIAHIVFDNWVPTSDGRLTHLRTPFSFSLNSLPLISYQIDGGSIQTIQAFSLADNFNRSVGALTANDTLLYFLGSFSVTAGQVVTIKQVTIDLGGNSGFNPQSTGAFSGSVFLMASSATRLSEFVAVPEPAEEAACAAAGLLAFGLWRWKAIRCRKG